LTPLSLEQLSPPKHYCYKRDKVITMSGITNSEEGRSIGLGAVIYVRVKLTIGRDRRGQTLAPTLLNIIAIIEPSSSVSLV
jgi:hypothetical protein